MSWADVFPILTDEMVERYENEASDEEKARIGGHFEVAGIYCRDAEVAEGRGGFSKDSPGLGDSLRLCGDSSMAEAEKDHDRDGSCHGGHVAAVSLFWKPMWREQEDYPLPTRELMRNAGKKGIATRFGNPWKHYVEPVLRAGALLRKDRPEVTLRVYLANDLSFMIDDLIDAGCEVYLMKSSSLRAAPGMLWRFLAMEEEECLVTMTDSDLADTILPNLERTKLMAEGGLKYWRVPYQPGPGELNHGNPGWYRTSIGCHSGAAVTLPVSLLAEALLWNLERGTIKTHCTVGSRKIKIWGANWPDYGFDEFFLNTAIFPRVAKEGILTLLNRRDTSQSYWFALDIEHCMKANSASEIMYFSRPENVTLRV